MTALDLSAEWRGRLPSANIRSGGDQRERNVRVKNLVRRIAQKKKRSSSQPKQQSPRMNEGQNHAKEEFLFVPNNPTPPSCMHTVQPVASTAASSERRSETHRSKSKAKRQDTSFRILARADVMERAKGAMWAERIEQVERVGKKLSLADSDTIHSSNTPGVNVDALITHYQDHRRVRGLGEKSVV